MEMKHSLKEEYRYVEIYRICETPNTISINVSGQGQHPVLYVFSTSVFRLENLIPVYLENF